MRLLWLDQREFELTLVELQSPVYFIPMFSDPHNLCNEVAKWCAVATCSMARCNWHEGCGLCQDLNLGFLSSRAKLHQQEELMWHFFCTLQLQIQLTSDTHHVVGAAWTVVRFTKSQVWDVFPHDKRHSEGLNHLCPDWRAVSTPPHYIVGFMMVCAALVMISNWQVITIYV